MSNHLHIVLKLCPDKSEAWTQRQVFERWSSLFKGTPVVQNYLAGNPLFPGQDALLVNHEATYRERLNSLSWFMKCLNEPIARQANLEDKCTGHFWESRFKSQALLSEEALLSCMAYVDLNPIRACMADTPEESTHTSIKERIAPCFSKTEALAGQPEYGSFKQSHFAIKPMCQFEGNTTKQIQTGIQFDIQDYLALVDTTGRIIREDKRGVIPLHMPPILERLGINQQTWLQQATQFERLYQKRFARPPRKVDKQCA